MKNILLTGPPKVGKTTVILSIINKINGKCSGFYTEEIKEGQKRMGFRLITLDNEECVLSHKGFKNVYRVGSYGVSLDCIEKTGVTAVKTGIDNSRIVIIDEIGKMELYSKKFKDIVIKALDSNSMVLGTILFSPNKFCDEIKTRGDVKIIEVTKENRNVLPNKIIEILSQDVLDF